MKVIVCLIVSTLALSAASADPKAEKEVVAAMDSFRQAVVHKDAAALEKLLSSEITYSHSGGLLQTKPEAIKGITSGAALEAMDFSETSVRCYDKTAVVKTRVDSRHSATDIGHLNILLVWVKGPQGWQIVARQATKLDK